MKLRLARALVAAAVLAGATSVAAAPPKTVPVRRPVSRRPPPKVPRPAATVQSAPTGLKARLGVARASRALKSSDVAERVRGFERLGAVGTAAASELLEKSLEPGGAAKGVEDRLTVVRALARRAAEPGPRQALARAMASATSGRADDAGETLVRDTAALALARSGHRDALEILGKALRQEGPVAASAARAIVAHPPRTLEPITSARGAPTRTLVEALEALGDQRAFSTLRSWVKHGSSELKGRSAIALTRLGDYETVELARLWLAKHKKDTSLVVAATQILVIARAPEAGRALGALLENPEAADAGLELLATARSAELLPVLEKRLAKADESSAPSLLGVIGRLGTPAAATVLSKHLATPRHSSAAAYALATCPAAEARDALARALAVPGTRRHAARAAVIREALLGDRVPDLDATLRALIVSDDAADRAAGAWGIATRDPGHARTLLGRADPVVVRAAARAVHDDRTAVVAAERLATEKDPLTRTALSVSLSRESSAAHVPTAVLIELVESGGAASAVAAKALAARDTLAERPQIERLSKSGDPLIRAHIALGLADSRDPSAVGLMREMYRFEQNADVRHALVTALSTRSDRSRLDTLKLAADLDGDERVQSAARLAVAGARLSALPRGRATLWLTLTESGGSAKHPPQARVGTPSGVALPVVADPDGQVLVTGLPEGPLSLRLAADALERQAEPR
ncbi:MAG: HEAT repeat domain-containing protein [Polyangiaceae bacterium]|nr:HEAT repeat domain-containing protein [Polyangiaceae bacterium]